jgi:hypothetical protein
LTVTLDVLFAFVSIVGDGFRVIGMRMLLKFVGNR